MSNLLRSDDRAGAREIEPIGKGHELDFTEACYRELLRLAKEKWTFADYSRRREEGRVCLWRHDVDLSPNRALRLAQIESEEGVAATYFVHLRSTFYNTFEPIVTGIFREIAAAGHHIGLHFDPTAYATRSDFDTLERALSFESTVLSELLGVPIGVFSYHNIDSARGFMSDDDVVAGLVNVYSREVRDRFAYVSDSNGFWRFQRLRDVLANGTSDRLHILTHPEWWTPTPMSPRDRVSRCIDGRAAAQHREYDVALERFGRPNVR